jgi:hypothetical protein
MHATFSVPLPFSLDTLELQPVLSSGASSTTNPVTGAPVNPLSPSTSGSVMGTVLQQRALAFGPLRITVADARQIAVDGFALAICLLLGALVLLVRASGGRGDGVAEILGRYRRSLVRVARAPRPSESELVELGDMETLVRIAERYDRMILHESMMGADTFWVPEDGVLYRYAIPSEVHVRQPFEPSPVVAAQAAGVPADASGLEADLVAAAQNAVVHRLATAKGLDARDVHWGPWTASGQA